MIHLLEKLYEINRKTKMIILILLDLITLVLSFYVSITLRLDNVNLISNFNDFAVFFIILPITIFIFYHFNMYSTVIRFLSFNFIFQLLKSVFLSSILMFIISLLLDFHLPKSIPVFYFLLSYFLICSTRLFIRSIYTQINLKYSKKIAIFGTDTNSKILLKILSENTRLNVVSFFTKENFNHENYVDGIKVYNFKKYSNLIEKNNIQCLYVTDKNTLKNNFFKNTVLNIISKKPLEIKILNNLDEELTRYNFNQIYKNIDIDDLLINHKIKEKKSKPILKLKSNILITGAGGSIGQELCKQILLNNPKSLVLIDHSEISLYEIRENLLKIKELNYIKTKIIFFLGSIQNENFLSQVFSNNNIDIVFHAAAYKHVPIVEENVLESLNNNVFSTHNLILESIKNKIKNFILVSSDKAVYPTNIMGATKRLSEVMCQSYSNNITKFSIVRFGNVMRSSGSVIPLFESQIKKGGPITVTDKNVTRYFMSISEAVELVMETIPITKGNEVFLLNMGEPKKILDIAIKMIHLNGYNFYFKNGNDNNMNSRKDFYLAIKLIGLRHGEKLHEQLSYETKLTKTKNRKIFKTNENVLLTYNIKETLKKLKKAKENSNINGIRDILLNSPINFIKKS